MFECIASGRSQRYTAILPVTAFGSQVYVYPFSILISAQNEFKAHVLRYMNEPHNICDSFKNKLLLCANIGM